MREDWWARAGFFCILVSGAITFYVIYLVARLIPE